MSVHEWPAPLKWWREINEICSFRKIFIPISEEHDFADLQLLPCYLPEMILAGSEFASSKSAREKFFLYDIVANGRNGIDIDKLMATTRVLGDEICYRAKHYLDVYKLFATLADLHRTVYTHAKLKLDDSIITTTETAPDPELREARDLILRIRRRDLYQFCNECAVPKDKLKHFKEVTAQDIICSRKSGGLVLKEEDVAVSNVRIDLTPVRLLWMFIFLAKNKQANGPDIEGHNGNGADFESNEKFSMPDDHVSHLLPACCQDMIARVYSKEPELVGPISEAFENFQLKTYGIKTQVRATPEKKET
ncbi:hypothetical protein Ancab_005519 [Ancistrocladus abbreviatus]